MSVDERQRQFRAKIEALSGIRPDARVAENFGFSNSARVIEGGLFACTNNLQTYSRNLADDPSRAVSQFVFLCVLTFPPQDEVYFAIVVGQEAGKANSGLVKLVREVEERNKTASKPSSINNNVKFYITSNGNLYFHNTDFLDRIDETALDPECLARVVIEADIGGRIKGEATQLPRPLQRGEMTFGLHRVECFGRMA